MLDLTRSFFGHFFDLRRIGLDHRQQVAAGRVLCCLAQEYPDTPYCPWLPMLVACSMTCMEEEEVFLTGSALLTREPSLIRSRKDTWLMLCTFDDLANRLLPEARAALLEMASFREGDDLRGHPLRGAVLLWLTDLLPRPSLLVALRSFARSADNSVSRCGHDIYYIPLKGIIATTTTTTPLTRLKRDRSKS